MDFTMERVKQMLILLKGNRYYARAGISLFHPAGMERSVLLCAPVRKGSGMREIRSLSLILTAY